MAFDPTTSFRIPGPLHGIRAVMALLAASVFGMSFVMAALRMAMHEPPAGLLGILPFLLAMVAVPQFVVALWIAPFDLVVGADGLLLRRIGARRFYAWSTVTSVVSTPHGVQLDLRDGSSLQLRTASLGPTFKAVKSAQTQQRDVLLARIRAAKGVSHTDTPLLGGELVRGDRSVVDWLASLRDLAQRTEGGMRRAPVLRDDLWHTLADPNTDEEHRAAAAVALSATKDDQTRTRLRVAAQAAASPRLRVLLESTADGDDDAVTAALDHVAVRARRSG